MPKKLLTLIGLLIIYSAHATAPVFVSKDSLMRNNEVFRLRPVQWKYHEGKNKKWVLKDFDDSDWSKSTLETFEKMPTDGKAYCFRLHFKADSTIEDPLYLRFLFNVPSLVFLNGKQVNYNNQGTHFNDYIIDHLFNYPVLIDIHTENVLVIFSDFSTRNFLKNKTFFNVNYPVVPQIVTNTQVYEQKIRTQRFNMVLSTLLVALAMLAFFSWFLVSQDRADKNRVWMATIISIILIDRTIQFFIADLGLLFKDTSVVYSIWSFINATWVLLIAPVISNVVQNKTDKFAKNLFLTSMGLACITNLFSANAIIQQYGGIFGLFIGLIIVIYIIILIKKNLSQLSKPQWTVIGGLFITLMAGIITVLIETYFFTDYRYYYLLLFITFISFPVSLLIYASLKLRQNYVTIQQKATQIAELSAEKEKILKDQNEQLEQQVEARTAELKASQTQLIQKEKLASLGELTAGIAHEIQNPLNFVNNFSEVSTELVAELKEGPFQQLPDSEKDYAEEILSDLTQNLQKITHHGGRASSIVKGMLEHSRMGTGERVPTDLNKLTDEYLRLSYHGMKAKDKNFQADFKILAGSNLPLINVVPQEIGRVLLNLFNNAFYAVKEVESPKVIVATSHTDKQVIIKVQDNGTGIPDAIKSKIFQPFFTTKPTGEGTGLGLSLSYDIITKGHGGTMEVESTEGPGSEFMIKLPIV